MSKALAAAAMALCLIVGVAACGSDSKDSSGTTSTTADDSGTATDAPVALDGAVTNKGTKDVSTEGQAAKLDVDLDNFFFQPTFIKVAPGQKVTLELENDGSVPHTFTSPTLNVDKVLAADAKETVEVTAPAGGSVQFYCRFHQDSGMKGALFETAG